LGASADELKANTLYALKKMGLASETDILFMDHRRVSHANVVFDLGMEERRSVVRRWVKRQGILLAGRFGEWDYLWSNQAFLSGLRAGQGDALPRADSQAAPAN
jgi:protoporphyrinogen oxidase